MTTFVAFKIAWVRERLITNIAPKYCFCCMDSGVVLKIALLWKSFVTDLTNERFFSCMDSFVKLQSTWLRKCFLAFTAWDLHCVWLKLNWLGIWDIIPLDNGKEKVKVRLILKERFVSSQRLLEGVPPWTGCFMWEEIKRIIMLGRGKATQVYFLWLFIYDNYDYAYLTRNGIILNESLVSHFLHHSHQNLTPGWGWRDVLPFFKASEDQLNPSYAKVIIIILWGPDQPLLWQGHTPSLCGRAPACGGCRLQDPPFGCFP